MMEDKKNVGHNKDKDHATTRLEEGTQRLKT